MSLTVELTQIFDKFGRTLNGAPPFRRKISADEQYLTFSHDALFEVGRFPIQRQRIELLRTGVAALLDY